MGDPRCRFLLASCAVAVVALQADAQQGTAYGGSPPPVYTDLGTLRHPIATSSPKAQEYFNQGLRLYYGFNQEESARAFREAARLDPKSPMPHWGVAMALGP